MATIRWNLWVLGFYFTSKSVVLCWWFRVVQKSEYSYQKEWKVKIYQHKETVKIHVPGEAMGQFNILW